MNVSIPVVETQAAKRGSGPGRCLKGFEAGEIIKLRAKRQELGKRPGIAIGQVQYKIPDHLLKVFNRCCEPCHQNKLIGLF